MCSMRKLLKSAAAFHILYSLLLIGMSSVVETTSMGSADLTQMSVHRHRRHLRSLLSMALLFARSVLGIGTHCICLRMVRCMQVVAMEICSLVLAMSLRRRTHL